MPGEGEDAEGAQVTVSLEDEEWGEEEDGDGICGEVEEAETEAEAEADAVVDAVATTGIAAAASDGGCDDMMMACCITQD